MAVDLIQKDLHDIHVPGIIALWASLEVAVEDTATLILMNDIRAIPDVVHLGVKIPSNCQTPPDESNARRVFARFEQVSRRTRTIAEAYAHMLSVLGVPMSPKTEVLEVLSELNYVRNCILHRGGIVDSRVAIEAPDLRGTVGDTISITRDDYLRYLHAVNAFAREVLTSAIGSRHARWRVVDP